MPVGAVVSCGWLVATVRSICASEGACDLVVVLEVAVEGWMRSGRAGPLTCKPCLATWRTCMCGDVVMTTLMLWLRWFVPVLGNGSCKLTPQCAARIA